MAHRRSFNTDSSHQSKKPSAREIPTQKFPELNIADAFQVEHALGEIELPLLAPHLNSDDLPTDITFSSFCLLFFSKSIPLSLMRALPFSQSIIFYIILSWYNDKQLTSGFGLTLSSNAFFNAILNLNAAECTGIYTSKYFGAKLYKNMRLSYYRGIGISILTFLFSLIFFARLDLILILVGFSSESSSIAWHGILA